MMCPRCQRYNPDDREECEYCGSPLSKPTRDARYSKEAPQNYHQRNYNASEYQSKTGVGVLLCLFLGLLGLIIGLLLYPAYSMERETFLNGWKKCFIVVIIISVIIGVIVGVRTACLLSQMRRYY